MMLEFVLPGVTVSVPLVGFFTVEGEQAGKPPSVALPSITYFALCGVAGVGKVSVPDAKVTALGLLAGRRNE